MSKKQFKKKSKDEKRTLHGKKISPDAFKVVDSGSTDNQNPVFSFQFTCANHFQLSDWQHDELKGLISKLRELSGKRWVEIKSLKGFKPVDPATFSKQLPQNVPQDATIFECRTSGKARLFGYRINNIFHIVWFDRNHQVYPM